MTYAEGQTTSHPFQGSGLPSRPTKCGDGHTLIEALVAVMLLCLVLALPAMTLIRGLERAHSRGTAQMMQGAIAQGQIDSLLLGESRDITCTAEALRVEGGVHAWETPQSCPHVQANIVRWRDGLDAVRLRVTPPFGAPNAAGSVTLLPGGGGHVVVVRASSGLTRREAQ